MRVVAVRTELVVGAADEDARQILLSATVDQTTTYREVYAALEEDWEQEGQSPIDSSTSEDEMDNLFARSITALRKRDVALMTTPFFKSAPAKWTRERVAFFAVSWTTDED